MEGFVKKDSGSDSSTICPPSMKRTLSATARANCISWVTITMVIPSFASSRITSSTSRTISGSSAAVTSSNSMISGCMHKARTIAARCFCPPDSCLGYAFSFPDSPTLFRRARASSSTSDRLRFCTCTGARVIFSRIVLCGNNS